MKDLRTDITAVFDAGIPSDGTYEILSPVRPVGQLSELTSPLPQRLLSDCVEKGKLIMIEFFVFCACFTESSFISSILKAEKV